MVEHSSIAYVQGFMRGIQRSCPIAGLYKQATGRRNKENNISFTRMNMSLFFNITCVIGTRPEALKMIPVINALKTIKEFNVLTIVTGQHKELVESLLLKEKIAINANFSVMQDNQTLSSLSARLLVHFEKYLNTNPCDLIIAQGDTTTTQIAALSAFYKKIPFAHVEAGLRTPHINSPFPEELNRRITSIIAALHFCPTQQAATNLAREEIRDNVYITGNTIIDMLYSYTQKKPVALLSNKKIILVTCHRREIFGAPLLVICEALRELAQRNPLIEIIMPVHPNPNVHSVIYNHLANVANISLTAPLDYEELVVIMQQSYLILTDSGGLQEEGPALQKPVLVLREETERPEALAIGASMLVGHDEKRVIINAVEHLLFNKEHYQQMSNAGSPYGDGQASQRIAQHIKKFLYTSQKRAPVKVIKKTSRPAYLID